MVTSILQVKTTLAEMASECRTLFGKGARLDDCGDLYWFAYNSTPVEHGYVRIPMDDDIAAALESAVANGYVSPNADLIRVEWHGQDRVVTGVDEDGQPVIEEQLFQVATQTGEDGIERPIYLGRIG